MVKSAKYVNHVSFDDLSPSLIDDQIRHLKQQNLPLTFTNPFVHIPPQYNPMYVESSSRFDDGSPGSAFGSGKRPQYNLEMAFTPRSQRDVGTLYHLTPDWAPFDDLRRTKSDMSPGSSRSTSLTRTTTSPSSVFLGRLPPAPNASSLKLGRDHEDGDIEDVDLNNMDRQKEKHIEHETQRNTQENSGSSAGYTTSAFSHLNEVEDKLILEGSGERQPESKPAKKSFAGMTDEQIAALEKKYESAARTSYNINQFDFGEQQQLYIGPEHNRSSGVGNQQPVSIYPSRPCVTHKALSISRISPDFEAYIQSQLGETSRVALRTVLCYISGRRHTWSSVDWYVNNVARDGDYLVILSRVPVYDDLVGTPKQSVNSSLDKYPFGKAGTTSRRKSDTKSVNSTETGLMIRDIDTLARQKGTEILDYYTDKCSTKCMKITIELIKDDSFMNAMTSGISLYRPDMQIISTVSTNLQIKFKNGHVKLPYFVMKHYCIPTCVIPYEFINPALLGEPVKETRKPPVKHIYESDDAALDILDQVILKTLNNPFKLRANLHEPTEEDDEGDVASVNSYFPADPETNRKIEDFERLGYLRPTPTRRPSDLSKVNSYVSSSKSSRRGSRVQFREDYSPIYKVKSLLDASDDVLEDRESASVRKTKSISNVSGPSLSRKLSATRRTISHESPALNSSKKKSNKFGGFLKKLGLGK